MRVGKLVVQGTYVRTYVHTCVIVDYCQSKGQTKHPFKEGTEPCLRVGQYCGVGKLLGYCCIHRRFLSAASVLKSLMEGTLMWAKYVFKSYPMISVNSSS